ncbi:hypothetical protein QWZ08_00285 [Ferruginibacter paludis]|uniref:hypothetical protein n=1 Tax=Ferruginibacter paludis TaxID=1310417 RepID=UPI0025B30484|nr:hypothetical protein [Ferruginibacter paludis]MDN3654038.1 hypothetical protein [Ferruginibacter paludis]
MHFFAHRFTACDIYYRQVTGCRGKGCFAVYFTAVLPLFGIYRSSAEAISKQTKTKYISAAGEVQRRALWMNRSKGCNIIQHWSLLASLTIKSLKTTQ